MRAFKRRLGIIAFWLSWPALWVYLRGSQRTRLLIVCNDEILVLRSWLGNGSWGLPGGGIHKGETVIDGLIREVKEETGIQVSSKQLKSLGEADARESGLHFHYHAYVYILPTKPDLSLQRHEILESWWMPQYAVESNNCSPVLKEVLNRWQASI